MKTVIDAVSEFKGEYFDGECGREDYQNEVVMAKRDFGGYRFGDLGIGSGNTKQNEYWLLICTRKEFLATVAECETNFGNCNPINVSHYKLADKVLLDKELDVMKTVIDAVSEFKAKLSKYVNSTHTIYINPENDRWYFNDGVCQVIGVKVCTHDEFLATVAECETNFGNCKQSYSDYKFDYHLHPALKRNKPTKELDVMEGINKGDLIRIKGKIYKLRDHFATTSSRHQELIDSGFLEQEPQPTPIFTQEMADNDVLPSVGHSFRVDNEAESDSRIIDFKGLEVEVIGLSKLDDDTVITFSHPTMGIGCGVYFQSWVKPLTPPITLIDGKAYQFDMFNGNIPRKSVSGIYSADDDEFIYLQNVVRTGDCTNIQPLTVEVK